MNVRVKFLGGAGSVSGSRYLLDINDHKILVDCGLFQGLKELRLRNWDNFPVPPEKIDAVILTHAHIDHVGYLPKLVKEGFSGPVYCTQPTEDLVRILLLDSAKLQEEEAAFARKKGYSKHADPQPLYDTKDAESVFPLINPVAYGDTLKINGEIKVKFHNAGHILGASSVEIILNGSNQKKTMLFSGDIGRLDDPILYNPTLFEEADILFIESTYGDRDNPQGNQKKELSDVVNQAIDRRGCLLIPAFAVGRTQMMLYYMKELIEDGLIPDIPVFIDSPMAFSVTELYKKYISFHKLKEHMLGTNENAVFDFKNIQYRRSQEQSIEINEIRNDAVVISSSGMCTGGRILHHLFHRLQRPNDTVLFVGYQAEGTRGRKILEGEPTVKIFGLEVPVKCNIERLEGYSAHADREELLSWLSAFRSSPKQVFVVHGEPKCADIFAKTIRDKFNWNVTVPGYLESHELFRGI
ncbi:MAG TPA: MBL fold metallo-hydrolase [Cyclobacteriaceae bacterium]|nr:MBL fold metallo-hydrolase [Cyclobacteriaceae bacterium]